MTFPISPTDGGKANVNGVTYTYSEARTAWTVTSNFLETFTGNALVANTATVAQTVSAGTISAGNTTLGNSTLDTLTVNTSVQSSLVPNQNETYDLGSDSFRWRDLFLSGNTLTLGDIVIKDTGNNEIGFFRSNGSTPANVARNSINTSRIANGASSLSVATADGNLVATVNSSQVAVVSAAGITATNIAASGNITVTGQLSAAGITATNIAASASVTSTVNFGNGAAVNYSAVPLGTAQGQRAGYSFRATFEGTGDNGPRRTADIFAGFNGGSWGNEFLAFGVGTGGQNDVANQTSERMRIDGAGALILVGSTAQKATGTTWSNPSDERLKDNIRDYGKGIAELMQVRVREWEYNGKGGTVEGTKGLGVVADEVMVVLPDTVENYEAKLNADDEEVTAIKKFDATEITWLLVKTVQELKAINDAQAQTIESLTARVVALEQA